MACGLPRSQLEARAAFMPELRRRLPLARRHIVTPQSNFFVTDYEPKWSETFKRDQVLASRPGAKL